MTPKLSRIVTFIDCFLLTKSNDHIITWFCEITRQPKNIVSPLPKCLWPQRHRMMTYLQ